MLADLFGEDDAGSGPAAAGPATVTDAPLPPRRSTRLAGMYNLGATCYLNALLQTLLMTPEFRGAFHVAVLLLRYDMSIVTNVIDSHRHRDVCMSGIG